jgi:hypothetical protein
MSLQYSEFGARRHVPEADLVIVGDCGHPPPGGIEHREEHRSGRAEAPFQC